MSLNRIPIRPLAVCPASPIAVAKALALLKKKPTCSAVVAFDSALISGAMYQYSPDQYFVTLVPDRPYGVSDVTRSRRIKELLVTFGHDIRMQLAAGNGEALDQVISLLDPDPEAKHRVTGVLRQFADETQDDLELARKAIDFYEPDRR